MKKLFSLIFLAFISSQMWAANVNLFLCSHKDAVPATCTSGYSKNYGTLSGKLKGKTTNAFSGKGAKDTYSIATGSEITITPTPGTGYYFYGWQIEYASDYTINSDNTVTVKVGSTAVHIHAIFKQAVIATFYYQSKSYGYTSSKQDVYVIPGQTPAYSGSTPTKDEDTQYTYTFKGWSTSNSDPTGSVTALGPINSDTKYYARFTATPKAVKYTVSFAKNNNDWGTLSASQITNVPSDEGITVSNNQVTINGTTITATAANANAQYTYAFTDWTDGNGNALPAKVTGNLTIRANFSRTLRNYDVTVAVSPEGYGTVNYESVTNVPYGTTITTSTNTVNINGTTVTATPTASTAEYTYAFSSWTNGTATVTGALTVTANFTQTANNYSVTFKAADGTTTLQGPTNYSYGATITSCPIPVQQSGNTVFAGWTLNGNTSVVYTYEQIYNAMTVTGDMVFTAKYVPALSVTIPAFTNNGKVLVTANGTTYNVTSDGDEIYVANGSNVTIKAVPNAYYHFAAWEEDDQADDFIEYRPLNASVTYTPTWEQNVTLSLVDTENKAYYTDLYTDAEYAGKMLTVTMTGRRLTEGSWMTFCAPFEFDIPAGHALDGAVYRFINGTMTGTNTEGYISLDFVRTHKIEANVPYLVVAKTTTDTDLEFDGVTIEDAPEQKPVVASSRDVQFVSQPWKDALVNEALELADFYIASGNTLRYAKVGDPGTTIRAFRAYFHRLKDLNATPAPRRIVISLDGVETTKEIGVDGEIEDTTRKYMENGILYIERNGVRYNAQGQVAE